ncbi:MAG: FAD-dependent oxidoreductase [Bryobacteraceae bacterium]|nr:FAD-dependent oxidoreductase [Bryobacteraceae bacterium]
MSVSRRVLIVGGVAGGASCAARLRRLDESLEIVVFDRGPYVSFANCGLPYYVGNVIQDEAKLLVASPQLFAERFNIEVRTFHNVEAIDRETREITVKNTQNGAVSREKYDILVLSPGAAPLRPSLPGLDLPGVFSLRTIPDSRQIRDWLETRPVERAAVIGAGFIGLEMAENLAHRGLKVSLIEAAPQVMPPLDPEMASYVESHLRARAVDLHLNDPLAQIEQKEGVLRVQTKSGATVDAGIVILAMGVRPESDLARAAGLELGERGGIRVDAQMLTSDPHIYAVGDAVEMNDALTGEPAFVPLAGPANRQGRIAADAICGRDARFRGVQGTAVCGVFGLTVAMTGCTEKALKRIQKHDFEAIFLHPGHHVAYYPGAKPIHLKLVYERETGRLLGAQAVGVEGAERRIDVISMAIQMGATVHDLEEAELCYAPQYGAAKDPVNVAGMIAANVLRGDTMLAGWEDPPDGAYYLDVREPAEFAQGHLPGAVNIPLSQLRDRFGELPQDREIRVNCGVGQRSYYAVRFLRQNGYDARNLPGGIQTWRAYQEARR